VAMIVNSSELRAAGFDLREVIPLQLEAAARGAWRTRGAALKQIHGMGTRRYVLSPLLPILLYLLPHAAILLLCYYHTTITSPYHTIIPSTSDPVLLYYHYTIITSPSHTYYYTFYPVLYY
jgi:hypothetical protein